jgi:hypothetical protein
MYFRGSTLQFEVTTTDYDTGKVIARDYFFAEILVKEKPLDYNNI